MNDYKNRSSGFFYFVRKILVINLELKIHSKNVYVFCTRLKISSVLIEKFRGQIFVDLF